MKVYGARGTSRLGENGSLDFSHEARTLPLTKAKDGKRLWQDVISTRTHIPRAFVLKLESGAEHWNWRLSYRGLLSYQQPNKANSVPRYLEKDIGLDRFPTWTMDTR